MELKKYSLSDAVADWLIAEAEKDKTENNRLIVDQSKKSLMRSRPLMRSSTSS